MQSMKPAGLAFPSGFCATRSTRISRPDHLAGRGDSDISQEASAHGWQPAGGRRAVGVRLFYRWVSRQTQREAGRMGKTGGRTMGDKGQLMASAGSGVE